VLIVGGATRMPAIGRFLKRVTGLTPKPTVNPEEAVALGAAVQAGILDGRIAQRVFNPYHHDRTTSNLADDPNYRP
jgi:molecular chaperone DnaK (HSP70)